MRSTFFSHAFRGLLFLAASLAFSSAFAVTTGKVRCLGFQGGNASFDPTKYVYMAVQAHNPNASTVSNIQRITRVKGWKADGTLEDSGALPQPAYRVFPNKSIDYLIPTFLNYSQTSYAVEITWTNSDAAALPPMIQTWLGLIDNTGSFLAAVPVMCQ